MRYNFTAGVMGKWFTNVYVINAKLIIHLTLDPLIPDTDRLSRNGYRRH